MAYEFECKNVIDGCDGKVTGETRDEVLMAAGAHAAEVHDMPDLPNEVLEKVKTSIKPT